MRPEVLLLDCGGTLSWPPFARSNELLRELHGREVPEEVCFRGFYRSSHALEMHYREHGRYPAADAVGVHHWLYEKGLELEGHPGVWTMECTLELLRREGRMGKWDTTYPWVAEALERLHATGIPMAVVSNSDGSVTELLGDLGYAHFFEAIIDSYTEGFGKPEPGIFYLALERMGRADLAEQAKEAAQELAPRPPVVHAGDNYRYDFLAAREAGLHAVLIDPLKLYEEVPARERAESISDFAKRLAENTEL